MNMGDQVAHRISGPTAATMRATGSYMPATSRCARRISAAAAPRGCAHITGRRGFHQKVQVFAQFQGRPFMNLRSAARLGLTTGGELFEVRRRARTFTARGTSHGETTSAMLSAAFAKLGQKAGFRWLTQINRRPLPGGDELSSNNWQSRVVFRREQLRCPKLAWSPAGNRNRAATVHTLPSDGLRQR